MLKNKCCLYVIISIRFFSITICNLLIEFPSYVCMHVKVKVSPHHAIRPQKGSSGIAPHIRNLGARSGWVVQRHISAASPYGKSPCTHCTGSWVARMADLDGCGDEKNFCCHRLRTPNRTARSKSQYLLWYPGPCLCVLYWDWFAWVADGQKERLENCCEDLLEWGNSCDQNIGGRMYIQIIGYFSLMFHIQTFSLFALLIFFLIPNSKKLKYTVMSRDRNAGRGHSVKIDNSSIERVEEFKYLGTTLTDQNSIQEEIKSRLKLGNACYYSVQNLLSFRLLSKIEL